MPRVYSKKTTTYNHTLIQQCNINIQQHYSPTFSPINTKLPKTHLTEIYMKSNWFKQTNTQQTQYNAACSSIYCIKQHRLIYLTCLIHATIAKFHEILNTSHEFSDLTTVSFKSVNTQSTSTWKFVGENCVLLHWEKNTRTTVIQIYTQSSHLHTAIK